MMRETHTLRFYFLLYKKNHGFSGMTFMQPKNPTRRTFFPMRVDTLRSSWWNRLVRGVLMLNSIVMEGTPIVKRPLSPVSFCATSRISFGTHSGNGVTSSLCLPTGVHFLNSGKPVFGKPACQRDEGGPQTPMDVSNFPIYQSAHQNVGRIANRS
jgi:hypothetical protein